MNVIHLYTGNMIITTRGNEEKLRVFKRKAFRNIYGFVFNNMQQKRKIRTNAQLYQLFKKKDVIQFIRGSRIEWTYFVWRGWWKYVKKSIDRKKGQEDDRVKDGTTQGTTRRNWSGLGAGVWWKVVDVISFDDKESKLFVKATKKKNICINIKYSKISYVTKLLN